MQVANCTVFRVYLRHENKTAQNKLQRGPENIAQSLMHHHFATVRRRITRFAPKCSAKM